MYSGHSTSATPFSLRAPGSALVYTRSDTPSSFRVLPQGSSLFGSELGVSSERIARRIEETRQWLQDMNKEVRMARKKYLNQQKSASIVCSTLRASSALLTEKYGHQHTSNGVQPPRFRYSLNSFLDGTPFLTPRALCRYNTAVAELLTDDQLELMRRYVFDYDEASFADLLYADEIVPYTEQHTPYGEEEVPAAVRRFNERSRRALERLFAAPGGLADATVRAALLVPRVAPEDEGDGDDAAGENGGY
ncbi:uncharacterized protein TM35_000371550 [Trypanosoma theileri]|uniref:Uncharacterized protein n=1 Tax=Trypanosoma theileri TaxID=67003 RepID=A0A1X0NK95_9TRYP|nr:uncharacterized protein TM35_000371550 [Trypanosoma theileri]ORC85182.1 hypothetical protein TM35_000371550 [Trypanosoma theileri]